MPSLKILAGALLAALLAPAASAETYHFRVAAQGLVSPKQLQVSGLDAFPSTTVGQATSPALVSVTNSGNSLVTVFSTGITSGASDFSRTSDCSTLQPGASCSVSVTFAPTQAGLLTGALTIESDASGGSKVVSLSGTGIAVPCTESTTVFSYTGATQSLTVSPNCHNVTVTAWGAGGGLGGGSSGSLGGGGGFAKSSFMVEPGTRLSINVGKGGQGAPGYAGYAGGCVSGVFNGGGGACNGAGQGGGASHVFWNSTIYLVAGGGGGAGQSTGEDGGPGGGLIGSNGLMSGGVGFGLGGNTVSGTPGAGATYHGRTSAPGTAWSGVNVGVGGTGNTVFAMNNNHAGGGGGGGYYGGGAGVEGYDTFTGGSGGGGSSYVAASGTATTIESGSRTLPGGRTDPNYQSTIGGQSKNGLVVIRIW